MIYFVGFKLSNISNGYFVGKTFNSWSRVVFATISIIENFVIMIDPHKDEASISCLLWFLKLCSIDNETKPLLLDQTDDVMFQQLSKFLDCFAFLLKNKFSFPKP